MSDETITRAHLANVIHQNFGYSRAESSDLVDIVLEEINNALESEGEVKISGLGTFNVKEKGQRIGRNPKTMEEALILARKVISFRASNLLKDQINAN